jgi:hypothetical protein
MCISTFENNSISNRNPKVGVEKMIGAGQGDSLNSTPSVSCVLHLCWLAKSKTIIKIGKI